MHKIMMIAGLFLAAAVPAGAQAGVQNVHEVALTTSTIVQSVSVSTGATGADVARATSSGTLAGYFAIEVYNPTASGGTLVCGFDISLSGTLSSAWYGREIAAGSGVYWAVPSNRKLYCLSLAAAPTRATITQFK
jgi:hypothetical protein